jgi:hypothetical protein
VDRVDYARATPDEKANTPTRLPLATLTMQQLATSRARVPVAPLLHVDDHWARQSQWAAPRPIWPARGDHDLAQGAVAQSGFM